jgi:hypothetical protein
MAKKTSSMGEASQNKDICQPLFSHGVTQHDAHLKGLS